MDALGRADQVKLSALGIGRHGDEPPRLEGGRGLTRIDEPLADDHRRRVDGRIDIADPHRDQGDVVGLGAREEQGRARSERLRRSRADRKRIIDDVDEPERVLGDVAIIGHDQGDRLAHVADDITGNRGLQIALGPGRGSHAGRDDGALGHVGERGRGGSGAPPRGACRARGHPPRSAPLLPRADRRRGGSGTRRS